jgi:hypothetical protein
LFRSKSEKFISNSQSIACDLISYLRKLRNKIIQLYQNNDQKRE